MILLRFLTLLCAFWLVGAVPSFAQDNFELHVLVNEVAARRTITVPSLTNPAKNLAYHYFTIPTRLNPNKFTIVILPGGPGGSSSDDYSEIYGIPTTAAQYIFIDPRGTGANFKMGAASASKLSTPTNTSDVVAVIQAAKLTNFVVWGSSYGTVVATHLGYYFENHAELVQPKAIVLEGTLGKAIQFSEQFYEDIPMRVRDFYSHLPAETVQLLKKYRSKQKNRRAYNASLIELFQGVAYYDAANKYPAMNATLKTWIEDPALANRQPKPYMAYANMEPWQKQTHLNTYITCNELTRISSVEDQKKFKFGKLFVDAVAPCVPPLENPNLYDVKNFRITKIPLIYLQGLEDFQTTLSSALYHFTEQVQKAPGSSFTLFFGTGHSVFRNAFTSCRTNFVDDLKRAEFGLKSTKDCARRHRGLLKEYL